MDPKQILVAAIMDAIAAAGKLPEGVLQGRVIQHLLEARAVTDQLIGQGETRRVLDSPMSSRMS